MGQRKHGRARRKPKKDYGKLIALCAVALILVTAAVLLTVLPGLHTAGPTLIAGTPSPGIEPSQTASGGTSDSGITPSPTQQQETEILIQLMGDVLLHDTTTLRGGLQPDGTYDFNSYLDIISQSINGDLTIANIESPVDANGDGSGYSGYPRFNVPRAIVAALKNAGEMCIRDSLYYRAESLDGERIHQRLQPELSACRMQRSLPRPSHIFRRSGRRTKRILHNKHSIFRPDDIPGGRAPARLFKLPLQRKRAFGLPKLCARFPL